MLGVAIQRVLINYLRRKAPDTYMHETAVLRDRYRREMADAKTRFNKERVADSYKQARETLVAWLSLTVWDAK